MFQQQKLKARFQVEVPVDQQNNLEQYMTGTWRNKNQNIRNYIILEILDFNIDSKQQLVRGKDFHNFNWQLWMTIEFNGYQVHPGMCIDLNDFTKVEIASFQQQNGYVSQKMILTHNKQTPKKEIPCVREYIKTMKESSSVYQVSICQEYTGYYFLLRQVHSGYQACDLDLSSGAKEYTYEKEIIEPVQPKIKISQKTYQNIYPMLDEYDIVSQYDLENFKQWYNEKRNIIVPRIRLDKTILVSKKEQKNKYDEDAYEKLFWLIQLQQKFINKMIKQ